MITAASDVRRARPLGAMVLWLTGSLWGLPGCFESSIALDIDEIDTADPNEFEPPDEGFHERELGSDEDDFPITGIDTGTLTLTRVDPPSGPVLGGNVVKVVGSGFTEDALVFFDGRMAQPAETKLVNENTLAVMVPAGQLGPADVRVQVDEQNAVAEAGYTFHGLLLEPVLGSEAGNTLVSITVTGREFEDGVGVRFGTAPCTDLLIVTPNRLTCRTPAGRVGEVDVEVRYPDGEDTMLASDAFEYIENQASVNGGLAGGPIQGAVDVRVLDSSSNAPLPGAFVMIGDDTDTPLQGYTDMTGQLTLSTQLLRGPVTVHVSLDCFISTTFVSMDASNVTVLLDFAGELRCAQQGDPPPGGGRGVAGAMISGELVFPGSKEFGVNPWEIVPEPRIDEQRVTYVYTSQLGLWSSAVDPTRGGTTNRIVEGVSPIGDRGYPYTIFARPAGLAVYALAGLERIGGGEFVPFVMGVARNVVTAPGEETTDVDVFMNIPLDHRLQVGLTELPAGTPTGPLEYRVQAHLDLGGEGIIARRIGGVPFDLQRSYTGGGLFDFFAQPAFLGSLRDARYVLIAGWYTGGYDDFPYSEVVAFGVESSHDPVMVGGFLGIPVASAPSDGGDMPEDRVLRFDADGAQPDLYMMSLESEDGTPLWRFLAPGDVREAPVPDLSAIEGAAKLPPSGFLVWTVRGVKIDGFDFNRFDYSALRGDQWTHDTINTALVRYEQPEMPLETPMEQTVTPVVPLAPGQ